MSVKADTATQFGKELGEAYAEEKLDGAQETVDEIRVSIDERDRQAVLNAFGGMVNRIVGGIFAVVLGVIMLNVLLTLDIVNNSSGPFANVFNTIESVGGAALIFIVLGFLAAAGGVAVSMFRQGGM
jgi:tetrahydromethanopterin S-methyltransferase subunit F